jgi:beta-galactosidase
VDVPEGVDAVRRSSATGSWLFLLNHTRQEQRVAASGYDLATETQVGPSVAIPAGGVSVVRED